MSYGLQVVYNMRRCRPGQKQFLMTNGIRVFLIIYCKNFIVKISHSSAFVKVEPLKVTLAETYCINFTALAGCQGRKSWRVWRGGGGSPPKD